MSDAVPSPSGQPVVSDACSEVVIAAADGDWLAGLAKALVEERLAACVHVVVGVRAVYRWDGVIHDDGQSRIAVHTRTSLVPSIVAKADAEHPDLVPCVIALPISSGHRAYLRWIYEETIDPDAR